MTASIAQLVEQIPLKDKVVGSTPTGRTWFKCTGGEMADTLALGASAARHGGSSPLPCTNIEIGFSRFFCARERT